jgi:hypothetical protein
MFFMCIDPPFPVSAGAEHLWFHHAERAARAQPAMIPFIHAGSPRHNLHCPGLPIALYFGPLTRNLPAKSSEAIVKNNRLGPTVNSLAKSRTAASRNNEQQCKPSRITMNRKAAAGASCAKQKPGAVSRPGTIPEFQFHE